MEDQVKKLSLQNWLLTDKVLKNKINFHKNSELDQKTVRPHYRVRVGANQMIYTTLTQS